MKRMVLVLLLFFLSVLFQTCAKKDTTVVKKLPIPSRPYPTFDKIKVKKIFSLDMFPGVCIPFSNGIIQFESQDNSGKTHVLHWFNKKGELIKERIVKRAQGPTDIDYMVKCFTQDEKILFIDNNIYLKEINPSDLSVRTLEKITNKIDNYYTKYKWQAYTESDIECFNGQTITSFETPDYEKFNYYIVSYSGNFDRFKLIRDVERKTPEYRIRELKSGGKESFLDYDYFIKRHRHLAVDWKNRYVFYIPDCDKPRIVRMDFNGNHLTTIDLGINSDDFFSNKEKIDVWYRWASFDADMPAWLKKLPESTKIYSKLCPVLRGITVFGDFLLVTTGKRNWETFENEVLVYRLPNLSFEGSFFIPTGDWETAKYGKYFTTKRIIEKDDDFYIRNDCYEMELK